MLKVTLPTSSSVPTKGANLDPSDPTKNSESRIPVAGGRRSSGTCIFCTAVVKKRSSLANILFFDFHSIFSFDTLHLLSPLHSTPLSSPLLSSPFTMPHSTISRALRLCSKNLSQFRGVEVPTYQRHGVKQGIVHIGVGGFHRAHLAVYVDRLLEQFRQQDWSICGVGLQPFDASMRDALAPQDYLYTVIERAAAGSKARVVGSITDYIFAPGNSEAVIAKMANPDTHIVSMTITESGYYYNENTHELEADHPDIVSDLNGQGPPKTTFGYLTAALGRRYRAGLRPFTVMSCDNMQKNGHITRSMLLSFARLRDPDMASWLEKNGAFPNSMVDRITPRTLDSDKASLAEDFGIEDSWPVVTEPFMQWVLEDQFSDGRPSFEEVGVQVVKSLHEVEEFELMKLRLLNASHSAMAYLAYLAGFNYVHEVVADPLFNKYISNMMHEEVKPLLPAIPNVDVDQYCDSVLARFGNPTLKDEVTRICLGGSGKIPQFIMPSIAEQIVRETEQSGSGPLRRLTLCVAGWFRYLKSVDESGRGFKIDDPMSEELQNKANEGGKGPNALLGIRSLFGDDLRGDSRFVGELTSAMDALYREGALRTLERYA
ncbi:putative mannitol dehydrogenase [Sporormia fimetaria CBS 119925]|uniref:Mannitol 2-dehydrogenase n=1 Tax=Sporormia fimetaria CBS 119925 TaxID=1340428 RepID=A0A6A6V970_9PLEO|nr:putative mannitol dehydrogenase [Sporormia fimetaria CBS 119925]